MVMEELGLIAGVPVEMLRRDTFPASGPFIVQEATGLPYFDTTYRKKWREHATAVGVPKDVQSRDARAGGATEAEALGVRTEHIQKALGHRKVDTTLIYTRAEDAITAQVAQIRAGKHPGNTDDEQG